MHLRIFSLHDFATLWVLLLLFLAAAADAGEISGRVLDQDKKPVAEAIVFVQGEPSASDGRTASMDQVDEQFVPHVLPIVVGTMVDFPNRDQVHHHVYSFSKAKSFEIPLYKGEQVTPIRFDQLGVVKVGCNIHDWMSGVIVVLPNPYFAKTGEDGAFRLTDVPVGTQPLAVWHERATQSPDETVQQVEVSSTTTSLEMHIVREERASRRPVVGVRGYR